MDIVIAILAKNKAHCLPFYLTCIYNQTFPKQNLHLYIRTNDNSDSTATLLQNFLKEKGVEYKSVYFDDSSIDESLKQYKPHEWNTHRFKIMANIRQASIEYAKQLHAHYFVADCDNFIVPTVLDTLYRSRELGVIAPMLITENAYSNFHYDVNSRGYLKSKPLYWELLERSIQGLCIVKVVHCTYFLHTNILDHVCYDDGSERHEYVICSDTFVKKHIDQYLDNRRFYGFLVFSDTHDEFEKALASKWNQYLPMYERSYS